MKLHIRNILFISLLLTIGLCGCASRKKNTAQTRMYHAFFAKYNTYYNGNVSYKKAKKEQINQHKDNYLEQLPLLIVSNTSTRSIGSSDYDRAIEKSQKAIKNHSIKKKPIRKAGEKLSAKKKKFFAQKEFNPFLWKAWMMMANSYFEKGEFTEAASTYIYITRLYENDPKVMAMARIGLAKCYTEMDWLYEAEDLIARIRRDSVPDAQEPELARAQANLLIKQERYSEALPLLEKAIKRKDATSREKAREFYLMGQLYRELGDNTAAFKSFGKTISKNPPYELEFNARIRQTETVTNEDKKKIIRSLQRMLKSPKNEDYISQLHYAIGNLHMSSKDTIEAIKSYETGVAEGASSGYGTAMLHLSLAKIYWEQERFSKSDANYKKAINMIDKESDDYKLHKHRSDILPDLVTHTDIIEENSELLYWASLSEEELIPLIDKKIEFAKWEEELRKKTEKKEVRGRRFCRQRSCRGK
ncbi:MAG: tetratricopeptide repeat protein [Bacteroidaceae bacterium]|nr:tetratricopeptide repeat protein [Bacteroidaceae bacterium]